MSKRVSVKAKRAKNPQRGVFDRFVRTLVSPETLAGLRKYAHVVADGADAIEAMHGHICSSKCWHFPGFEEGCVRCSCRWEEGPTYRLYNGSSHEPTCWVHRVYIECGGLEGATAERASESLWRVQRSGRVDG